MVKICSYNYPKNNENDYNTYYNDYPYELHDFQKWAVEAIVTGNHVLISAPTGTGKTFGGEFAITYFHSKHKKVIYTTPIKALSNEKFYSFTQKYPNISFGLITGDIRCNPDADVLIMTTEILLNKLYQLKSQMVTQSLFEMDIQNDLGCVVFDEIHFISDENRGHVWEQSIMMLPSHIQMVGLSATLDNPEKFALWLETNKQDDKQNDKQVYLTRKNIRSVPLVHYSFITVSNSINKCIKDKAVRDEIVKQTNKLFVIQDEKNVFNDINYQNMNKMLKLFEKNNVKVKRQHVLNKLAEHLVEKEMLPALCYVFSRKTLEICAEEMTTNLLEFDSKVPYIADRECETIIRKFPNFEEYLKLPEYVNMVKLLRRGVGIHHAGLIPILREMTEMLFARGFIKILFCTETMSVGINLPVKTTIFTDINKFNGDTIRLLYSHEYTQAAGRAGRLGLDKIGNVIHLNNLFRNCDVISYKNMMNGKPQQLVSKFKISYNLILNLIDIGETNYIKYAKRSMSQIDIDEKSNYIYSSLSKLQTEFDNFTMNISTPIEIIDEYEAIQNERNRSVNKRRREIDKRIQELTDTYKSINNDKIIASKYRNKKEEITSLNKKLLEMEELIETDVNKIICDLEQNRFIEKVDDKYILTQRGKIATNIKELHCIVFTELIENNYLTDLKPYELVGILSCFTNITIPDDKRYICPITNYSKVKELVTNINLLYEKQMNNELKNKINTGFDYEINFDIIDFSIEWCLCNNDEECKELLQRIGQEKEVFLGEFIKAILKINNIVAELEKVAELLGNIEFLSVLKQIPIMTLKYVATNQSLYV